MNVLQNLHIEEHEVEGPEPIERILLLGSEPIAVAYLDRPTTECTFAWPLTSMTSLRLVLDCYLEDVLPQYSPPPSGKTLEFWIAGRYREHSIGAEPTINLIFDLLRNDRSQASDRLQLLQVASQHVVMELTFGEHTETPVRVALLISAVRVKSLARFFSQFHSNDTIRGNHDAALCALAPDEKLPASKSLFYPLPIL